MLNNTKHVCSNKTFNQQIDNVTIELEKLNENIEALIFKQTPPIVRELNSTTEFKVKRIVTSNTSYTPVGDVIGDTWTGTLTFKTNTGSGYVTNYVLNGYDVKALIIETEE